MTHKKLPPPPIRNPMEHNSWIGPDGYFSRLQTRVNTDGQIEWSQLLTEGSNLTDIETRNHSDLTNILGVDDTDTDATLNKHVSNNISKLNKDHREKTNLNAHGNTIDATITFDNGTNITFNTTTGTKIGTGTTQKIAFYNSTPIVQPTALTTAETQITHVSPSPADYAIQGVTSGSPFGFVTEDEGNTVMLVIKNLQVRLDEMETKLQSLGLLA